MATRWGIVGAGKISHDFAAGIQTLPESEHELVAVAASDLSRAQDFAKVHGVTKAYGSYQELAEDANVEVAYIGTIQTTHLKLAKMMLNAGKHVLCEKPLTMNLKQSKELIALAKSKGLFLMEAVWSRCFPIYDILREEIASGKVGEVKQVSANLGFGMLNVDRLNQRKLGGGTILDFGIYPIQFALMIFDHEKPVSIKASGHLSEDGIDLSMSAILTFSNERTATIFTQGLVDLSNEAYIFGTKDMIKLHSFWCPTQIRLSSARMQVITLPEPKHRLNFFNSAGLAYEAAEVRDCLKKGLRESPKITHENSLLIAEIQDEIRRQVGVVYDEDK